ncbi:MATE family efflux transporter [Bacterioplanes sanyensis]|uniref:MATE family efflux transporter n=2 Tax=Bacterioplanes sanyensis TaxID=1249553 RepID=A0A222FGM1_9GAMM|nr:MATE family efflux transporter [Bacterioplanes sanyensis]
MVIGILAVFFFNLVDTWFISLLGTDSLAAVGFALPVTLLVMNLAIGLGIAASALIAKAVGADDQRSAQQATSAALLLGLLLGIVIAVLGMLVNDALFLRLGASEALLPEIWSYMQFWWPGAVLMLLMMIQNSALRATGDTRLPSRMMLAAALLNAVLDPLLIFGLGPVPALGVGGAALASALCWLMVIGVIFYRQRRQGLLGLHGLPLQGILALWRRLMVLGIPAMITNMMVPVAGALLLMMVAPMGEKAVAGFGVGMRLEPFAIVVILALTSTLPTFVAQNQAANQWSRIWQALSHSYRFLLLWQLAVCALLWIFAPLLAGLFSSEAEVQRHIIDFVRWLPLGYAGMGVVLCANAALNSLQKTQLSMLLNLVRLFALYLPGAWLGMHIGQQWQQGYVGMLAGAALGNVLAGIAIWSMTVRLQQRGSLSIAGRTLTAK